MSAEHCFAKPSPANVHTASSATPRPVDVPPSSEQESGAAALLFVSPRHRLTPCPRGRDTHAGFHPVLRPRALPVGRGPVKPEPLRAHAGHQHPPNGRRRPAAAQQGAAEGPRPWEPLPRPAFCQPCAGRDALSSLRRCTARRSGLVGSCSRHPATRTADFQSHQTSLTRNCLAGPIVLSIRITLSLVSFPLATTT